MIIPKAIGFFIIGTSLLASGGSCFAASEHDALQNQAIVKLIKQNKKMRMSIDALGTQVVTLGSSLSSMEKGMHLMAHQNLVFKEKVKIQQVEIDELRERINVQATEPVSILYSKPPVKPTQSLNLRFNDDHMVRSRHK